MPLLAFVGNNTVWLRLLGKKTNKWTEDSEMRETVNSTIQWKKHSRILKTENLNYAS